MNRPPKRPVVQPLAPTLSQAELQSSKTTAEEQARHQILAFAERMQKKYPFEFAPGHRGVEGERNRKKQERRVTHFILKSLIRISDLDSESKSAARELACRLVAQIGFGGANFYPRDFTERERHLALTLTGYESSRLYSKAFELAKIVQSPLGPVNPAEHSICWSFRYVGQLLKAAEWEGAPRQHSLSSRKQPSRHSKGDTGNIPPRISS